MNSDYKQRPGLDTTFYDKESSFYSIKRYEGVADTYTKFFFKKRQQVLLSFIKSICIKDNEKLSLIDIGCADGVVTQEIDNTFPESFEKIIGIDVAPKMIEEAQKKNLKPNISFFVRGEEDVALKYDVALEVGFLNPTLFDQEFPFIKNILKENGYFICSVAAKQSIHSILKMRDKEYVKTYFNYNEYEKVFNDHFEVIRSEPYGLFIPKLWAFPNVANVIQPFLESILKFLTPGLFQEKLYLLKKRREVSFKE